MCTARNFLRVTKYLLAGVTVFCVSWIVSVSEWHTGVRWRGQQGRGMSTMRTIVAYSEGKLAEMEKPSPLSCDRLPAFPTIPEFNRTWVPGVNAEPSWQHVEGTNVSLYAAFYDERTTQRYVRILATFTGRNVTSERALYCQTRSSNSYEDSVEVVVARPLEIWWQGWDQTSTSVDTPVLLSCPLTEALYEPSVVSVVTEPCDDPTNAYMIKPSQSKRVYERTFTVCVKDMNFDKDVSQNLIEWIETNKILGVNKIDIYVQKVTLETQNVLIHYRNEGYVRLFNVPISYKPNRTLWQRRRDHLITYNDCLYRNLLESEYIVPLDVDEIIVPKIADTWTELLNRLYENGWDPAKNSAIAIRNKFFYGFMQNIDQYERKYVFARKFNEENNTYTKQDDVWIKMKGDTDLNVIELSLDSTENYNEVIISDNEKDLIENYKVRCGRRLPVPKLARHIVCSAVVSPEGDYTKSMMVTNKVLTAFNHYPLYSLGNMRFSKWSAPLEEVQLNHYRESCNTMLMDECPKYTRQARVDRTALRLRPRLMRALANAICMPINDNT